VKNRDSTISFILNDQLVNIDFSKDTHLTPTTTVLNYLRGLTNLKGIKEGCAEGDCGACTVVIAESNNNQLIHKAIDACLVFLPMIHGKKLITVEYLGSSDNLHPVQKAMVDTDGSQCGFCTPGFVMSLFSLYKNQNKPTREQIDDALTGNLCRCTGYRSIVEAATISCVKNGKDHFTKNKLHSIRRLSKIKKTSIHISTSTQNYYRPSSLREALQLRVKQPKAHLLCGATDLALRVTKNNELLSEIIDLGGLPELQKIKEANGQILIGAGVDLETTKEATEKQFPALHKMLAVFGSQQIRNLATIGGNLASASPIGDIAPVLMAYNAGVELQSSKNKRTIPANEFISGYRKTKMKPDEIITGVIIPVSDKNTIVKSYKISKRKDLDISTVSSGFQLKLNKNQQVEQIELVYGGMAAMTKRASTAETFLTGKTWSRENIYRAMDLIDREFSPISDARSGAEGRRIMARNLLLKFWTETQ